jgi:tRNA(Leu) C34 or U34 (ribose-2'-O)-methylase TrmL
LNISNVWYKCVSTIQEAQALKNDNIKTLRAASSQYTDKVEQSKNISVLLGPEATELPSKQRRNEVLHKKQPVYEYVESRNERKRSMIWQN